MRGLIRGLRENTAATDPCHADPRLRGRTYAIPFDRVWTESLALAGGGLSRWRVLHADDEAGLIHAGSTTLVFRFVDDVRISITLDENAQTRVDLESRSRKGRGDLGRNPRTLRRFLRALDRRLGATSREILDASHVPTWSD